MNWKAILTFEQRYCLLGSNFVVRYMKVLPRRIMRQRWRSSSVLTSNFRRWALGDENKTSVSTLIRREAKRLGREVEFGDDWSRRS